MLNNKYLRTVLATSAICAGMISIGGAVAQDAPLQAAPSTSMSSDDFDSAALDAFVMAYVEVNMIGQTFAPQLQAAATPEEQMEVQTEASEQMMGAIDAVEGIDIDGYNEIMAVAQTDTELATRINTRLEAAAAAGQ